VHQARCLGATLPDDAAQLDAALDTLTAGLTTSTADRPFGRDIETLRDRLADRRQTGARPERSESSPGDPATRG
jgi:hypothetical protein